MIIRQFKTFYLQIRLPVEGIYFFFLHIFYEKPLEKNMCSIGN